MGRREKPQDFVVWPAGVDAAAAIADLAEARRQVYRTYSPVFWRPAPDARARHLPFLSACLADGHHTAFVAESAGATVAAVIADHHVRTPPFAQDREASWLVDDFYVAAPGWWDAAGGALLESVAAAARRSRQERLIVVSAGRDDPKNAMLQHRGFQQAAQWWVRRLEPPKSPVPAEGEHLPALVGPAPPVYDPGGLVALALDTASPFTIDRFERQASAGEAVLAIVPARTADGTLTDALAAAGYTAASVWYAREF